MALDESTSRLWVVDERNDLVRILDAANGTEVASTAVASYPGSIALDPASRRAWISSSAEDTLTVVDMDTVKEVARIRISARYPGDIAIDHTTHRVFVGSGDGLNYPTFITVFDGLALRGVTQFAFGTRAPLLEVDPERGQLYVVDNAARQLSILSQDSFEVIATLPTGIGPQGIALGSGGRLYVANMCYQLSFCQHGTVSVFDVEARTQVATFDVAYRPDRLAFAPQTGVLMLGDVNEKIVWRASPVDGRTIGASEAMPRHPGQIMPDPTRFRAFVASPEGTIYSLRDEMSAPNGRVSNAGVLVAPVQTLDGSVTDDFSGIDAVDVVYRPSDGSPSSEQASVTCANATRRNCTWSADLPLMPGVYALEVTFTDRASNVAVVTESTVVV